MPHIPNGLEYKYSLIQNDARERIPYRSPGFLMKALIILVLLTTSFVAGRLSLNSDAKTGLINCALCFLRTLLH